MTITVVLCYVVFLRVLARNSREIDQRVDYSKIRPWRDDEK